MAILNRPKKGQEGPRSNILDVTANMQGSLVFQEPVSLRINGRFEGNLETRGDLTIGENARVAADITGEIITVAGRMNGKVVAKQKLTIVPPAVIEGEIWTPVLQVEEGARIEASIHMVHEEGRFMNSEEVAGYLEMEVHLVEQWAAEGKIPAQREGEKWRFEKARVDEWVAAQKSS